MNTTIDHYLTEHARIANALAGQDNPWLEQMRTAALQRFTTLGFPTTQEEDWKYTSVAALEKERFTCADKTPIKLDLKTLANALLNDLPCFRLTFINGHFAAELSQLNGLTKDITIGSLAQMLKQEPATLKPYLQSTLNDAALGFTQLNTAFLNDGAYIHLAANSKLDSPIHLLFINTTHNPAEMTAVRNLIVAEKNSNAIIIENYISTDDSKNFNNVVSEIILHEHAHLEHYNLQQENIHTFHIGATQVQQHAHSEFISHSFTMGGGLVRSDTNVNLKEEHAACTLNGLYLARDRQHIDHHTLIEHAKPHGTSREYYKGVLAERSRAVFNGKVIVHLDAQKTDAQQTNKNLLLSRDAEIDTKPQLEIYADDVQCTHGAAVGQLDNSALFYLRTRGMDEAEARSILIYAFIREIIERVTVLPLRNYLQHHLFAHLPVKLMLEELS